MNAETVRERGDVTDDPKITVQGRKRKRIIVLVAILATIVVIAGMAFIFLSAPRLNENQRPASIVTNTNATSVAIPLNLITNTTSWYQYSVDGTWVRFFAVRDSIDIVHVAFDECPICYPSHQGFRQEGIRMVENCCDMEIAISDITEVGCSGGGCHPAFLPSHIEGGNLVISISDLVNGAHLFVR